MGGDAELEFCVDGVGGRGGDGEGVGAGGVGGADECHARILADREEGV